MSAASRPPAVADCLRKRTHEAADPVWKIRRSSRLTLDHDPKAIVVEAVVGRPRVAAGRAAVFRPVVPRPAAHDAVVAAPLAARIDPGAAAVAAQAVVAPLADVAMD